MSDSFDAADERFEMVLEMLAVLIERGALQPVGFRYLKPTLGRLLERGLLLGATCTPVFTSTLTSAWRASASFLRVKVSMWRSPFCQVIDDPRFALLAASGRPLPLPYRHASYSSFV